MPTASAAFDALYTRHAPDLTRQAIVLTGHPRLSQEAVERSFQMAWQRWPDMAVDPDPAGRVRAMVHEYALSPWHRMRPGLRTAQRPTPRRPHHRPSLPLSARCGRRCWRCPPRTGGCCSCTTASAWN